MMFLKIFEKRKKKKVEKTSPEISLWKGVDTKLHISVERIGYRPFYDSQWRVVVPCFSMTLIRRDDETAANLLSLISSLPSIEEKEIEKLDERDTIYYD